MKRLTVAIAGFMSSLRACGTAAPSVPGVGSGAIPDRDPECRDPERRERLGARERSNRSAVQQGRPRRPVDDRRRARQGRRQHRHDAYRGKARRAARRSPAAARQRRRPRRSETPQEPQSFSSRRRSRIPPNDRTLRRRLPVHCGSWRRPSANNADDGADRSPAQTLTPGCDSLIGDEITVRVAARHLRLEVLDQLRRRGTSACSYGRRDLLRGGLLTGSLRRSEPHVDGRARPPSAPARWCAAPAAARPAWRGSSGR